MEALGGPPTPTSLNTDLDLNIVGTNIATTNNLMIPKHHLIVDPTN